MGGRGTEERKPTHTDSEGKSKIGRDERDGSYRQERIDWSQNKGTDKHDHYISKTDPTSGKHKEIYIGPNAPREKNKKD